jgi:hypothetical protein
MSRKDYEAIAKILRTFRDEQRSPKYDIDAMVADLSWSLADYLQSDNPAFNRERFLKAVAHV